MADVAFAPSPTPTRGTRVRLLVEIAVMLVVVGMALGQRVQNLDAYTGSFDEGIRSEQLLLMAAGYRPFRDIFASQGPLLLDLLYPFYLLFGQTLAAARSGVVACSLVGLVGAWWTARTIGGPVAGLAAVAILTLSPTYLADSRLALAEVPTIAPALLALGSLLAYRRLKDRRLLVLSAVMCALALLVKPMVLHVGVPLGWLLLAPDRLSPRAWLAHTWRQTLADVLVYGLVVAAFCAVTIGLLGPSEVWDNLGAYRGGAGHRLGADAVQNLILTRNVLRAEQFGLPVLVVAGLPLVLLWRPIQTLALLAWAAAVLGLFAAYGDLSDKHIVYLVPPLVLLAAVGAACAVTAARDAVQGIIAPGGGRAARSRSASLLAAFVGGAGLLAYGITVQQLYRAGQYLIREEPKVAALRRGRDGDQEIAQIIRARTPENGWVLADNPNAAFDARRKVIPYLVDTSGTRIDAGSLTAALATEYVQRYQPSVIVTWPRRLGKLDDFVRRLPELGYRLEKSYELGWKVYVREESGVRSQESGGLTSQSVFAIPFTSPSGLLLTPGS